MSINRISTIVRMDRDEPYCKRAKLDTGTYCNQRCWFCYYKDQLDEVTPLETIKERIDYLAECGIQDVDLSGGESSLHEDWFEILDYCFSKGMRISTLSNGGRFSDIDFLTKSVNHGLKEILFSLHGNKAAHNRMVGGDSFNLIIRAIQNANDLGIRVRINCVVSQVNYRHLALTFPKLIKLLKPYQVNFLTLNRWDNAGQLELLPYELSTNTIKACIDRMDFVPNINVRYTPYCYMVGYEKYVCNIYQHIHDKYDWNIALYSGNLEPDEYKGNELDCLYETAKTHRLDGYDKPYECVACMYFQLCDGIEKGSNQGVHPVTGRRMFEVNHYRKGYYED